MKDPLAVLLSLRQRARWPQALMLHGQNGVGRRYLARWIAAAILGLDEKHCEQFARAYFETDASSAGCHPDFLEIQPPPDKKIINVDLIRSLIEFLQLRSHGGGDRVTIIAPAEAMNQEAANCLLKVLEEPPGGAAIMLVVESPAQLPPTIVSRCHKMRISGPAPEMLRQWLRGVDPATDWDLLLEFASGRPLQALALSRSGFADTVRQYQQDLVQLQNGAVTPVTVARRWKSADPGLLLRWLYGDVARAIIEASLRGEAASGLKVNDWPLKSPAKPLTIDHMYERLREIEELYRNRHRPINPELQLTAVLQRWFSGAARNAGG